jgi:predicted phosphodiesterase
MIYARVRIQFVSDIHLEMYKRVPFDPTHFVMPGQAEYLALCGDIGYPEDLLLEEFLRFCSRNFRIVFWVPGNHEFYSPSSQMTVQEKFTKMQSLCQKFGNILLMNEQGYNVPGTPIRIIGCPLWTHIPEESKRQAEKYMNDFRLIFKAPNQRMTVNDLNEWHAANVAWIQSEIQAAKDSGRELVVLTHHLPTQRLVHQKYEGHPLNACFATSLDPLIQYPIRAWLCGHSHTGNEARVNEVLCALNPGGYPGENETSGDPEKILTVIVKDEEAPYDFNEDTYITGQDYVDTSSSEEE